MSDPDDRHEFPAAAFLTQWPTANTVELADGMDIQVTLDNLSTLRARMDSVHQFLSYSVNANTVIGQDQMDMVSAEIASAIRQVIVNGAALLACSEIPKPFCQSEQIPCKHSETPNSLPESDLKSNPAPVPSIDLKVETTDEEISNDEWHIVELDAVELLAEHLHFCEICGKGFKRDANLRMHMRAHGNQFKTPEALAKPESSLTELTRRRMTRFSCPFSGCNRNKQHRKFRPLKSVICVKNHFKRSHCPKMFSCNKCHKKSFSVVADLKSHLKHCGETKWKCSCGTSFSRKDKLFGHMALFEGHMPAVMEDDDNVKEAPMLVMEDEEDHEDDKVVKGVVGLGEKSNSMDSGLFEEFLEGFGSIDNFCLQDVLGEISVGTGMDWNL